MHEGNQLYLNLQAVKRADIGVGGKRTASFGVICPETDIQFKVKWGNKIKLTSQRQAGKNLFKPDFKFEDMKIGGLDSELANIFRRAFASRRFPPAMIEKYGIKHVKGMLLYGPPGTGKTLIARQLSHALKAKEPVIVNGPEIFSKFVG
jgi:vesicle-fusing ATPase